MWLAVTEKENGYLDLDWINEFWFYFIFDVEQDHLVSFWKFENFDKIVIAFQNSKKDGFFKDVNAEFKKNFNYVISHYEKHPEHNRFTVEYVRTVLREQLNYPIGRQQCLIYMSRLGYKLVKPKKQNLITMSARIKRLKVRNRDERTRIFFDSCSVLVLGVKNSFCSRYVLVRENQQNVRNH